MPQWVAKDPSFLHADNEDSHQTGWMSRLICVFAGCTGHFVCFVMRRLKYFEKLFLTMDLEPVEIQLKYCSCLLGP